MKQLLIATMISLVSFAMIGWKLAGLRRSETELRDSLLTATPIGSTRDAVDALKKKQRWKSESVRLNAGFFKQEAGKQNTIVGVSSVRATLGNYWTFPFLATDVSAYWGFDDKDRLIDVWVWKTIDAP